MKIQSRLISLSFIVFLAFLYASPGIAQNSSITTQQLIDDAAIPLNQEGQNFLTIQPSQEDASINLIGGVLGGDPSEVVERLPMIGDAMFVFNAICMGMASLLFIFISVTGAVHTAVDGELLGKKWSAAWVPLRVALAIGMLTPIPSGFSLGQIAAMGIVRYGIAAANTIWTSAAEGFAGKVASTGVAGQTKNIDAIKSAFSEMLRAETCTLATNKYNAVYHPNKPKITRKINGSSIVWDDSSLFFGDSCGKATIPGTGTTNGSNQVISNQSNNNASGDQSIANFNAKLPAASVTKNVDASISSFTSAVHEVQHSLIVNNVLPALEELAQSLVPDLKSIGEIDTGVTTVPQYTVDPNFRGPNKEAVDKRLTEITTRYIEETTKAANQLFKSTKVGSAMTEAIKSSENLGWIIAGTWYFQIAKISSAVSSAVNTLPSASANPVDTKDANLAKMRSGENDVESNNKSLVKKLLKLNAEEAIRDSILHKIAKMIGLPPMSSITTGGAEKIAYLVGFDPNTNTHPLIQLQESGAWIMGLAIGAMIFPIVLLGIAKGFEGSAIGTLVNIASGAVEFASVLIEKFSFLLNLILIPLLLVGIAKAIYIPFLPMIKWIKQVVFWVVSVLELLAAIPLWLTFHMAPRGEGWSSENAKVGYQMLMEVALRPSLLVIALIFSFLLMWPTMLFVNKIFIMSASFINTEFGWTFLLAIICEAVLYCVVMYYLVDSCCDVIDTLPPKVLQWVSVHANGVHSSIEHSVHGAFLAFRNQTGEMIKNLKNAKPAKAGNGSASNQGNMTQTKP